MDSLLDSRFNAFLEDKIQQYSFAKKLMEFCLNYSYKIDWKHFAKYNHFLIKVDSPFRRSEIHFKKKYARIWMPIRTNAKFEDGIEIIKEVLGDDAELGIQDGATMRALHPVIDTDEKCEALIKWLSHQQKQISSSSNVKTASDLFKLVKEDDVLNAINAFENGLIHEFGPSTQYDLIHKGKPYPPKAILGIACRAVSGGRLLKPEEFSGGEDSICFRTLRREGFTIQPKGKISKVEQNLSVTPNIFCMLMVHFFIQNRESMIWDLSMNDTSTTYFPDDAQKYLEFKKVKVYGEDVESLKAEEIVPMIEELAGEIFPYFSFMSRIAPELSKFSKSILFPLDKPEQYVDAYRIGWLGFLSILDSENFDTNHYHCLASLLRHLADTGTEDLSEHSSYFINLIKSSMRGSAKNLLVDDSFPSNYFTSSKILDQTIKFLPRRSNSTVYDPACGLGGFLMKAFDRIYSKEKSKEFSINTITGADIDPMCVNLAKVFYMCKVFFTDTECMGLEEMIKFLGEVAPNIVQQDSLSEKVGIFPESKNDFIYCNPPFDDLIEGSQESSYNHHGFIKIAEEFVEKGGQAVLLLPHSFLVSKRDRDCRKELITNHRIRHLREYQFTANPEDKKIVVLLKSPQSTRTPKLAVQKKSNEDEISFDVSYSSIPYTEEYTLNIEDLREKELGSHISDLSNEFFDDTFFTDQLSSEISEAKDYLDEVSLGIERVSRYSEKLEKISGKKFYFELISIVNIKFLNNDYSPLHDKPNCFIPFHPRRGLIPNNITVFSHESEQYPEIHGPGLALWFDPSILNPFYLKFWIRFSRILGLPFSMSGRRMLDMTNIIQNLEEKFNKTTIFIPPIELQRDLFCIFENKSFLHYLISQRRLMPPTSRNKFSKKDLIALLFRFDPENFPFGPGPHFAA